MNSKLFLLIALICGLFFIAPGCGDDDDDTGAGGGDASTGDTDADGDADGDTDADGDVDAAVAVTVVAADGGTVATASGAASIEIPAGALAADTEITINTLAKGDQPDAANLGSNAFELGPDGATFSTPVTLTLKLDVEVPAEKTATIAVLNDGAWEPISGSTVADGSVSASIDHFSTYVILFTDEGAQLTTAECADLDFTPCGGSLEGVWSVEDICMEGTLGGANQFADTAGCEDMVWEVTVDWLGSAEFKADGTYVSSMSDAAMTMHAEFPDACLTASMGGSSGQEICDMLSDPNGMGTCTYSAGVCTCENTQSTTGDSEAMQEAGTYTIEGTKVTLVDTESTTTEYEFCVDGDTAVIAMEQVTQADTDSSDTDVVQTSYAILKKQ